MIEIKADDYASAFEQLADMLLAQTKAPLVLAFEASDKRFRVTIRLRPPHRAERVDS